MARFSQIAVTVLSLMAVSSQPLLSQAKNLDSLVTVSMYDPNPDYLEFVVHRPLLKRLSVITQLVCRVEMVSKVSGAKRIVVELTDLPPHFFDFSDSDAVMYRPHGLNRPQIISSACRGGADFLEADAGSVRGPGSGRNGLQTSESSAGIGKWSDKHSVPLGTNKDGTPTSLATLIKGSSAPSAEDKEFLDDLKSLGPSGLHQPETKAILEALRASRTSSSEEHHGDASPEKPPAAAAKLIGPMPPLAIVPFGAPASAINSGAFAPTAGSSIETVPHPSAEPSPAESERATEKKAGPTLPSTGIEQPTSTPAGSGEKSPVVVGPSDSGTSSAVGAKSQKEIDAETKAAEKAAKQQAKQDAKAAKAKAKAEEDSNPDAAKPEHVHHDHKKKGDPSQPPGL